MLEGKNLDLRLRAFELFPDPVELRPTSFDDGEWKQLISLSEELGVSLALPHERPRTKKAHEASRFGKTIGLEREVRLGIYEGYWQHGLDIGRIDVLLGVGARAGIDPEELKIALDIDRHEAEVMFDQDMALRLRIPGTPVLYVGSGRNATIVVGARGPAELERLIRDAPETLEPDKQNV